MDKEIAQVVKMVAVLLAVCLVYRLVNVLFTSLQLIAKLPIVRWLDKVLGIAVGFAEAGLMVMVFIHVLKNWGLSIL